MPKVIRSPPANPSKQKCLSDPEVAVTSDASDDKVAQTTRRRVKRRLEVEESNDRFDQLRDEMMSVLNVIKANQESCMNSISKLTLEVSDLKLCIDKVQKSNIEIEKAVESLSCRHDVLKDKVDALEHKDDDNTEYMKALEKQVEDLQRGKRNSTIEIRNIPSNKHETKREIAKFVEETCKFLNVEVRQYDIRDAYRTKSKNGSITIFAEFSSTITKSKVIDAVKSFNKKDKSKKLNSADIGIEGTPVPIYIVESLTVKGRMLFFLARDTAKSCDFKYCWTSNGKIYLRKLDGAPHIEVTSEAQLENLKALK